MSIELPLVMGIWNALLVVASIVVVLTAGIKIVTSSSWYKKRFAQSQNEWANLTRRVFDPLKRKLFSDLEQHLRSMEGDALEIGIGPGSNFGYYPQGTSLIAVDSNPHVEESLKRNLEKACRKIYLKKFVAASAEDMSCKGEIGVDDNSVAAVVCAKLLCNLSDLQMRKTIAEVKRVLMPGGRFYFLEHVAAKPWTCQYFLQHLATKLRIWPSLYDGCCCNQNTLSYIHDGGFKWMQSEKIQANCSQEMFSAPNSIYSIWRARVILYFVNIWLVGLAEKGQLSEEKKKL